MAENGIDEVTYSKEELENISLGDLLDEMNFPSGKEILIKAGIRNKPVFRSLSA